MDEFNRRNTPTPIDYQPGWSRRRACDLTGHHDWVEGRGYQQNGLEVYVRRCAHCNQGTNLPKRGNEHLADGPVIYDNRPSCCQGQGCVLCNPNPCQRCGTHTNTQMHHWAPSYLFGWQEANRWPTGWLCQPCHTTWHQTVTPNMNRRTA